MIPIPFYWPASPSSGGAFDEPNDENRIMGCVARQQVSYYRIQKILFRYVSEFGFQSFPSEDGRDLYRAGRQECFSYVMESTSAIRAPTEKS